ncbi:hypothetical protein SAMN06264364_106117 [Quadrisphaera granulorum]|uniref:Uncharacterized protein n=1 Tax=Quadrisphaera granulorum TaxID=317664 RepID=A0A316ACQ7_9ACTN|nr:hypothetical protein [Quadrisphaera granulorum]PWJ54674.1 hypothetical protein BXY45_106117 [Quadrisphaera granulorum]SZE96036.1 hypothetical protein SAMN06264364_106117 [Quadrisphaera granulorum]
MTSTTTARALRETGLQWTPAKGDRFVIPDREMDDVVFVVSDMTIEAHDLPSGQVLGFNGTTEWALDSVDAAQVLWLPREGQLRELLGAAMVSLRPVGPSAGSPAGNLWAVTTRRPGGAEVTTTAEDAEEAYALALLALRATTARQLLPVAAGGLAAVLAPLPAESWTTTAPMTMTTTLTTTGALSVADVVAGAVGGLGADPAAGWRAGLAALLEAWTRPLESGPAEGVQGVEGHGSHVMPGADPVQVAEAGAKGVLVDLAGATWDVAVAAAADPTLDPGLDPAAALDPAVVACALAHVRTWPTSPARSVPVPGSSDDSGDGGDHDDDQQAALAELLRLTGRQQAMFR